MIIVVLLITSIRRWKMAWDVALNAIGHFEIKYKFFFSPFFIIINSRLEATHMQRCDKAHNNKQIFLLNHFVHSLSELKCNERAKKSQRQRKRKKKHILGNVLAARHTHDEHSAYIQGTMQKEEESFSVYITNQWILLNN